MRDQYGTFDELKTDLESSGYEPCADTMPPSPLTRADYTREREACPDLFRGELDRTFNQWAAEYLAAGALVDWGAA